MNLSLIIKKGTESSPGCGGSVGWELSHKAKGCLFNSQSGHMSRLWVWSPVGVHMGGKQSMFLPHIDVDLFLSFPSSLSKKNGNGIKCPQVRI